MKKNSLTYAAALLIMAGVAGCNNTATNQNPEATVPVATEGGLKVAYIDTDTLLSKYQYAIDVEKEVREYGEQQRRYGQQQVDAFRRDYENYLQTGSTMTLSQQQAKEAELQQMAEKMQTLEQELLTKMAEKQSAETVKVMNAITAFVREYNAANQKFDIVLTKGATLYINPAMDITEEIVNGLNEEYGRIRKK
ncbi:MAG: OmpH family outer membrane protein [Bacteroidales bacterium]|nr:OmpH family outer membrane protein [Bacteroidales bacterium]